MFRLLCSTWAELTCACRSFLIEKAQPLLHTLQLYQQQWDPRGAISISGDDGLRDLCKAMTIRDCTLFVLIGADGAAEARLGDLDMKGQDKLGRWQAIEQGLLDGGWYTGDDPICRLSRS